MAAAQQASAWSDAGSTRCGGAGLVGPRLRSRGAIGCGGVFAAGGRSENERNHCELSDAHHGLHGDGEGSPRACGGGQVTKKRYRDATVVVRVGLQSP
jgi:hypothetical protein